MFENREISEASEGKPQERLGKVCGRKPNVYVTEKSDTNIVPEKEPNKTVFPKTVAEVLEGRAVTKGNSGKPACDLNAETGVNIEWT